MCRAPCFSRSVNSSAAYLGRAAWPPATGSGIGDDPLLWVYYSCQSLLLGAEFTRVYAQRDGTKPAPESFAEKDLDAPLGVDAVPV